MRINIYAPLIIIEILDEIYARAQNWSSEYVSDQHQNKYKYCSTIDLMYYNVSNVFEVLLNLV
jgi:hypothetical protein